VGADLVSCVLYTKDCRALTFALAKLSCIIVACRIKVKMWLRKATTRRPQNAVYVIIALLVINGCCDHTGGQHLPTRDELNFQLHRNHPEIFYDTKLLPDGAEVTSYVLKKLTSR